jgi:hypothetical protein
MRHILEFDEFQQCRLQFKTHQPTTSKAKIPVSIPYRRKFYFNHHNKYTIRRNINITGDIFMKRTMEITVINKSESELARQSENLTHGKWTDGVKPPVVIGPNSSGYVNSQKQTGSSYGTEGRCAYTIMDKDSNHPVLSIDWDKPYGHGESKLAASVAPDFPYTATVETISKSDEHYIACVTLTGKSEPKINIASWMTKNWDLLASKKINRICLPGSHDSGTFKVTYETRFGSARNTKTQLLNFGMQLMEGIRVFDVRPVLYMDQFHTAHTSHVDTISIGWQGAIGVKLDEAFAQIREFCAKDENKNELIILDFSHFLDWSNRDEHADFNKETMLKFEKFIQQNLGVALVRGASGDLLKMTLSELIYGTGTGRRNIIARFSDFDKECTNPQNGLWDKDELPMTGEYSNTNDLKKMVNSQLIELRKSERGSSSNNLFSLCWQLTLDSSQSAIAGSASILDLAEEANPALHKNLTDWINKGLINKSTFPNIINTDACQESVTKAVALSLKITAIANE